MVPINTPKLEHTDERTQFAPGSAGFSRVNVKQQEFRSDGRQVGSRAPFSPVVVTPQQVPAMGSYSAADPCCAPSCATAAAPSKPKAPKPGRASIH